MNPCSKGREFFQGLCTVLATHSVCIGVATSAEIIAVVHRHGVATRHKGVLGSHTMTFFTVHSTATEGAVHSWQAILIVAEVAIIGGIFIGHPAGGVTATALRMGWTG